MKNSSFYYSSALIFSLVTIALFFSVLFSFTHIIYADSTPYQLPPTSVRLNLPTQGNTTQVNSNNPADSNPYSSLPGSPATQGNTTQVNSNNPADSNPYSSLPGSPATQGNPAQDNLENNSGSSGSHINSGNRGQRQQIILATPDSNVQLFDPIGKSIEDIFRSILDIVMVFAAPIVVFFIIWAGFLYVTAAGNSEKITKATTALTYAVIGGVIVLGAKVLLEVITNTIQLFSP